MPAGVDWKKAVGFDALQYPVPQHNNTLQYSLGGLTLICFSLTFLTGFLLTQFYNPTPAVAYASVRYISLKPGPAFLRGLHFWSANIGFFILILHMLRVIFTGAYRPPRTVNYLVGLALLFVSVQNYFTGTVIRWDQGGYEALSHFVAVNKLLGPLGAFFQEDFTLSTPMLSRVYGLHTSVFPVLLVALAALHAMYWRHLGPAPRSRQSEAEYLASLEQGATYWGYAQKLVLYGLIVTGALVALAIISPPGLLDAPRAGVEITKPPWVFWIFYPLESWIGIGGILLGSAVLVTGLLAVPALGLAITDQEKLLRTVNIITILGLIAWAALLVIAYFSPLGQHL